MARRKKETSKEVTAESVAEQIKEVAMKNELKANAEEKRLYNRFCKQIESEYQKMEKCYLNSAFALHALYEKKLYKVGGYQNIYDLAADRFNLARGTCNNFINICKQFGRPNENGTISDLQERFQNYGMSQLIVMLGMNDELLNMCSSDMTVRALKELKSSYIQAHSPEPEQLSVDSQLNEPEEESEYNDSVIDAEQYSFTVPDGKLFVCQALSFDDLMNLKDTLVEAMKEVKKDSKAKCPRFEVNIIFD